MKAMTDAVVLGGGAAGLTAGVMLARTQFATLVVDGGAPPERARRPKDPASGLVVVDSQGATTVPGLWAAGNVVNRRAQVVTAAGAGSTAAINMTGWLLGRELSGVGGAG